MKDIIKIVWNFPIYRGVGLRDIEIPVSVITFTLWLILQIIMLIKVGILNAFRKRWLMDYLYVVNVFIRNLLQKKSFILQKNHYDCLFFCIWSLETCLSLPGFFKRDEKIKKITNLFYIFTLFSKCFVYLWRK